ncbi:hypothetical protein [Spirosoma panaciterrae]|uniref:hypothetical protein n=1 Tax=Spirosoma panaciterrae TaxID=496058 RepID=UPI00037C6D77|nr:hypothetical protein [Spirosoma panaciterrae]
MLTAAQQSALDYHLREINLLTNEELILELTDHYTVALAEFMAQGMTFETALVEVQNAFGGRKGLQKMERKYNRVTFAHYDQRWQQTLTAQFQKPLLWRQTVPVYLFVLVLSILWYTYNPLEGETWDKIFNGAAQGFILGKLVLVLSIAWPYLKALFRYGIHNPPTEALYLLKRHGFIIPILYATGVVGYYWILPIVPYPCQPILISLYLATFGLYMRTGNLMYESLYARYATH